MERKVRGFTTLGFFLFASVVCLAQGTTGACGTHCGQERWAVKTLTDPDAGHVTFAAQDKTVGDLIAIQAPTNSSGSGRLSAEEKTTFRVRARLVGYKIEFDPTKTPPGDRDFHIVLADLKDAKKTMIVEIPDAACAGVCESPKLVEIQKARADFVAPLAQPPQPEFLTVKGKVEVEVTGVGFFDFFHGQTGVAPNCLELHPVLNFRFVTPGKVQAVHKPDAQPKMAAHPDIVHHCIPSHH